MKKIISSILAFCLLVTLFPTAFAQEPDVKTVQVADFASFQTAINGATGDIVLNLTQDVLTNSSTSYTIQSDYAVTVTSNNGSKLILNNKALLIYSKVSFQNITIEGRGASAELYIQDDGEGHAGNVDVDNVTFVAGLRTDNDEISTSVRTFIYLYGDNATLTVYGMTADPVYQTTKKGALYLSKGTLIFIPTNNIIIPTIYQTRYFVNGFQIVPRDGYTITAAIFDGVDKTDALSQGTYTVPAVTANTKYSSGLSITVTQTTVISPCAAGGGTATVGENRIDYAWSYGGCVTEKDGTFTITPYTADGITYVIDTVYVDGSPVTVADKTKAMTVSNAAKSVFASFAYTVNFLNPADGTLSVSRGGTALTSGDIVRGGDVLTISVSGTSEAYVLDQLTLTGIKDNEDGTYTVTARNGEKTPAVSAAMKLKLTVAAPTFSVAAGNVAANTKVTISTDTEGASIYYTTDGTAPSASNGTLYDKPITIAADMTLKAVAVLDGYPDSEVASAAYCVDTKLYSIYVYGSNFTYSIWVNETALTEKSGVGNTTKEYPKAAKPGDTVEISVTPLDGYEITQLIVSWSNYAQSGTAEAAYDQDTGRYSFSMPVGWVSITATASAIKQVTVADGITGGTITADKAATSGSVSVTAVPDSGNHLKSISYSYDGQTWIKVVGNPATIEPTADVTVKAEFAQGADISIASAGELAAFSDAVNAGDAYIGATVSLTGDIALTGEWTPIGNSDDPFAGTFDGGGKTVSGLLITRDSLTCAGLFGDARTGTVQNLTVSGTISLSGVDTGESMYAGGVAGRAGTLTNCTSVVDIGMGRGYVGGLAGEAFGSVTGCKNYGTLTIAVDGIEALDVGGILGTTSAAAGSISECVNYGDITFDGGLYSVSDSKTGVTSTGNYASGCFGGLVGGTRIPEITSSCNKGSLAGDLRVAGGLVGYSGGAMTILDCYSTGSITETGNDGNKIRIRLGGLVGSSNYCGYDLTLENCYCTGEVTAQKPSSNIRIGELHCNAVDKGAFGGGHAVTAVTNSYGPSQKDRITAAQLSDAYQADSQNVNGGYPLLSWEDSQPSEEAYAVTFHVTPADAKVTVYSDSDRTQQVEKGTDGYLLKMGTYYYEIAAEGCGTQTGSFHVSIRPVTVTVELRQAAAVVFSVSPADAAFSLTDGSGKAVSADSAENGNYTYTLYSGATYRYSATADGYNGTTREYTVSGAATVSVTLKKSSQSGEDKTISAGKSAYKISEGGTYNLSAGDYQSAVITISTEDPVTLVGSGTGLSCICEDVHIDCVVAGVDLTLQDVYFSNTDKVTNLINYQGGGNTLNFKGVCILDQDTGASGYAMIHVNTSTSLTVTGGTAYFYKRDQGAGIGGNGGAKGSEGQAPEYNGDITIENAELFMKNSKQGALIGSGASASSSDYTPGEIRISDSALNLAAVSRGAAIGGGAGSTGGAKGTEVYIDSGSSVNINVDYSGSAIGGGGYAGGNDSDGGILHYAGGSIRTFIDQNAVDCGLWPGITKAGVNDIAITADKQDSNDNKVYLCRLDTALLGSQSGTYTVKDGTKTVYSGGLHKYRYVNERLYKTKQIIITYTIDNWVSLNDSNLYVYLTGEDHTLSVNGETLNAAWNAADQTFTVKNKSGKSSDSDAAANIAMTVLEVTPVTNGTVSTAAVTRSEMKQTLDKALDKMKKTGKAAGIEVKVNAPKTASEVRASIPSASIADVAGAGISALTVDTPVGIMELDSAAIVSLNEQSAASESVTIAVKKIAPSTLTEEQQKLVEGGTVVEADITAGGRSITRLGGGAATIMLPAGTVNSGQTARAYYLNSRGRLILMSGSYDADSNTVTLKTPHLSRYVVFSQSKWSSSFYDVNSADWYADAVEFVSVSGMFRGTSASSFSPGGPMTRAMLVTVLWRMEGSPAAEAAGFCDVTADSWCAEAVGWAASNGIVTGFSSDTFRPDDAVTRQQAAAILYRYAKSCGYDLSEAVDLGGYADESQIGSWAKAETAWAVGSGLITGMPDATLDPASALTRAQAAAILMRLQQNLAV